MNAMLACVDGAYLANSLRMVRSQDPRAFLIVEGETDEIFFERFIDPLRCKIEVAKGRENAIDVFDELQRTRFAGVLVVVDADFNVLDGRLPLPLGLLFTDTHDLETMLLASRAFDKLLRSVGKKDKLKAFEAKHGKVRETLLASAAPIGRFLWLSLSEKLNLRFEDLKFGKFVDDKTLHVDESSMIRAVLNHSSKHALDVGTIAAKLATLNVALHDPWHVCSGHHLTELLAIAFRKAIGSHDAGEMGVEQVERMLALAYEAADFPSTELYAAIRTWERLSPPFLVLA
jgi:hypothetical protein